jgi:hypothetical protein
MSQTLERDQHYTEALDGQIKNHPGVQIVRPTTGPHASLIRYLSPNGATFELRPYGMSLQDTPKNLQQAEVGAVLQAHQIPEIGWTKWEPCWDTTIPLTI